MTKQEALRYLEEKSDEGWLVHEFLLSIYDDDEDIPDEIIDLICHRPRPDKDIIIIVGPDLKEAIDMTCTHFILTETIKGNPQS